MLTPQFVLDVRPWLASYLNVPPLQLHAFPPVHLAIHRTAPPFVGAHNDRFVRYQAFVLLPIQPRQFALEKESVWSVPIADDRVMGKAVFVSQQ